MKGVEKIKLTKSTASHIGKTLLELRKTKKIKAYKDIKYNFILTLCKIWTGHKKYEKIATKMANEIYCLIEYYYNNKSGGGDELANYYLPCKANIYLKNITLKRCIVILRQFLKCHNYNLYSKEKFIKGVKYLIYYIGHESDTNIIPIKKEKIVISFD